MRKNKPTEDHVVQTSSLLSAHEVLVQHSSVIAGPDDLGELAGEVQSFIAQRNELARRLTLEIEATEKKLAELRRTKARLFPEGSSDLLVSESESQQRKPRKTKSIKTTQETVTVQRVTETVSHQGEASSRPVIDLIEDGADEDSEDGGPRIRPKRSVEVVHALGSERVEKTSGRSTKRRELHESHPSSPTLAFYPIRPAEPIQKIFDLPIVESHDHEAVTPTRLWTPPAVKHHAETASQLATERPRVLTSVRPSETRVTSYRAHRVLRTRVRRARRPGPWLRDWALLASASKLRKVARQRMMFSFLPHFSPNAVADELPGLQKSPRTSRYARRPMMQGDRRQLRQTYQPRRVKSTLRSLPLFWSRDGFRTGLKRARSAA
jgi:hypothetical protein